MTEPTAATIAREDAAEDAGRLHDNDRKTCHTCRTWATPEHRDSAAHKRAIGIPVHWQYDAAAGRFRPPIPTPA